jgi:hypothetical protein
MYLPRKKSLCSWSSRSLELTLCNFFVWGYLKDTIYRPSLEEIGLSTWCVPYDTRCPMLSVYYNFKVYTFESFSSNWRISHDCRLTNYFLINISKCIILFELPCICIVRRWSSREWNSVSTIFLASSASLLLLLSSPSGSCSISSDNYHS